MPTYHLHCLYRFTDGRNGSVVDNQAFEADTFEQATDLARIRSVDRKDMALVSAALTAPGNHIVWSIRAPVDPDQQRIVDWDLPPGAGI